MDRLTLDDIVIVPVVHEGKITGYSVWSLNETGIRKDIIFAGNLLDVRSFLTGLLTGRQEEE